MNELLGYILGVPWHDAREEKPPMYESVIVYMPGEDPHPTVREGYIVSGGVWYAGHFEREEGEVTHWIEMPKPPKEESHKPEDCRYYTINSFWGGGCLGTKEIDPCKGEGCERWKPKEE